MLNKNLERLEFDKILERLSSYCITNNAKKMALNLYPSNNKQDVEKLLKQTSNAVNLISKSGSIPIEPFNDVQVYIKNLESHYFLSAKALLETANILRLARLIKQYYYENEEFNTPKFSTLADIFLKLYSNENIEQKIFSSIIDENTIADDASKVLSSLRRNRKKLEQDVRDKLSNFTHSSTYSKYLMDTIVTIRNDRFVIPVKEEYKDKISGSILDMSSSGATLYVEPSIIYELNNKINGIKAEEAIEIEKILKNLSSLLFSIAENINTDVEIITLLDFIFAKAKYSKSIDGTEPQITDNKMFSFISARHPLINPDIVVPIDISVGENYTSLLITGPNTGGKTATLKTVGLLILMAQSGLYVPAKSASIFVFDNIFADIGDEQSIQESLSTFSSHILNIIDILNMSTKNSLILLDELGSGTDPIEGSSLAISILEYFHNLGSITIATTHYPELKNYALITDGFENASSDFDVQLMKPTYKLLIGVPGKSNAFAISKNLGLPDGIINRAYEFVKEDHINIENLLKNIYDDKLEIESEKENIKKNSNQIELLRKSLERDNSVLDEKAKNIILNAQSKAREILLDAKDEATSVIKELNDESISIKEANNLRNKLNNDIQKNDLNIYSENPLYNNIIPENIQIGATVLVKKLNQNATVLSIPNKDNELQVQIGFIKMNVKLDELANVTSENKPNKSDKNVSFKNNLKSQNISPEINVIGLTVDQAIPIVDKYLDDAYMSGLNTIRIVHGKGTGKLRKGIHAFLKTNPDVKSYRIGTFGEGEMGVTVVMLK